MNRYRRISTSWSPAVAIMIFLFIALISSTSQCRGGWSEYLERTSNSQFENDQVTSAIDQPVGISYSHGISRGNVLENGNITELNGSEIVNFTVSASPLGGKSYASNRSLESISEEISRKINRGNELVRNEGIDLIGPKSGPRRIDQICAIYNYLVDERNWTYVDDWTGLENFQYSNYTLEKGQNVGGLGKGDCDDFAILLGALVESVGAHPRILFAYGPNGGHAYVEVYLGKAGRPGGDVDRMMRWLRCEYEVEEINVHNDLSNGDVWLNLDWWKEPGGSNHPGGPFFIASKQVVVYPENKGEKEALTPLDIPPFAEFQVIPKVPTLGFNASFDATSSFDCDGNITSCRWDFGDGQSGAGRTVNHSYAKAGSMRVNLTVTNDQGLNDTNSTIVRINHPPIARFTYKPDHPMANEQIRLDADTSYDRDGKISNYSWEFGDNGTGLDASVLHGYDKIGTFNAMLTVTDDIGAQNSTAIPIEVSGAEITNVQSLGLVSQSFDLMGEYSLSDSSKSIWIFVKPQGDRYFPQTRDSCHPSSAYTENGRWETRITVGGSGDSGKYFELIAVVADENADQEIRRVLYEGWCSHNLTDAGFNDLPDGAQETNRIMVKRSDGEWNSSQDLSDISLPGSVDIAKLKGDNFQVYPGSGNASVDVRMTVHGNRSNDVLDEIWILVHSLKEGRWYPQSADNENNSGHVTNVLPKVQWTPDWYMDTFFTGDAGDPYELVVVLANSSADKFFNEFQKSCAMAKKPDGNIGNYTGLLTISLPAGIDEKDRMRVHRK